MFSCRIANEHRAYRAHQSTTEAAPAESRDVVQAPGTICTLLCLGALAAWSLLADAPSPELTRVCFHYESKLLPIQGGSGLNSTANLFSDRKETGFTLSADCFHDRKQSGFNLKATDPQNRKQRSRMLSISKEKPLEDRKIFPLFRAGAA